MALAFTMGKITKTMQPKHKENFGKPKSSFQLSSRETFLKMLTSSSCYLVSLAEKLCPHSLHDRFAVFTTALGILSIEVAIWPRGPVSLDPSLESL